MFVAFIGLMFLLACVAVMMEVVTGDGDDVTFLSVVEKMGMVVVGTLGVYAIGTVLSKILPVLIVTLIH